MKLELHRELYSGGEPPKTEEEAWTKAKEISKNTLPSELTEREVVDAPSALKEDHHGIVQQRPSDESGTASRAKQEVQQQPTTSAGASSPSSGSAPAVPEQQPDTSSSNSAPAVPERQPSTSPSASASSPSSAPLQK
ncbi:unnamed protein product, partial [Amoebophrya sp. A25]|eukprot:GSA25T00024984001.1